MLATAFTFGASAPPANATVVCPVTLGGSVSPRLAERDARERLGFIDVHLTQVAKQARIWTWGWGGGIAASGIASLAVVPFVQRADRIDWYTSAASAAIGVIPFAVAPLVVLRDARELHATIAAAPGAGAGTGGEAEVCTLLLDAESRLIRSAEDERSQQAWWLHAGNVAFNTGVALFLGLGFHHWASGLINGVSGVAVGEAILLTQPVGTVRDVETYRAASF